eukprot:gene7779-19442_t
MRPARIPVAGIRGAEGVIPLDRISTLIGRAPSSDLVLQGRSCDREHAVVRYDFGRAGFFIEDLTSLNGTF